MKSILGLCRVLLVSCAGLTLVACGGGGSGPVSGEVTSATSTVAAGKTGSSPSPTPSTPVSPTTPITPTAPTTPPVLPSVPAPELSYAVPAPLLLGNRINPLQPKVKGTVTRYSVNPALPAGLQLDATTGVITGTPTAPSPQSTYTITAANQTGAASFALILSVVPVIPSGLSYANPVIGTAGVAMALTPSVTGTVADYAVTPSLPPGLTIDPSSGVISGTPSSAVAQASYLVRASNASGTQTFALTLTVNPGAPTNLSYVSPAHFAVDASSMTLTPSVMGVVSQYSVSATLPTGLALNTSTGVISGTPLATMGPTTYTVTASNAVGSSSFQLTLQVDPGPTVVLSATTSGSTSFFYFWKTTDGQLQNADGSAVTVNSTQGPTINWQLPQGGGLHFAYLLVADGKGNCYEGRVVVDTDSLGAPQPAQTPTIFPRLNYSGNTNLVCTALTDHFFGTPAPSSQIPPTNNLISGMQATYNGSKNYAGAPFASFQPVYPSSITPTLPSSASSNEPSNALQQSETFLQLAKNTANDACAYYAVIGALGSSSSTLCNSYGNPTSAANPLNMTSWTQQYASHFSGYAINGRPDQAAAQFSSPAYFVNVMDLNLTRAHYSAAFYQSTGQGDTYSLAANVCNHLGPHDSSGNPVIVNPTQDPNAAPNASTQLIDQAVQNAQAGQNLVVCVAMDFVVSPINGTQYTRFYVFGPSGELLPSVNLDGRGEKYVPGACTSCHGGAAFSAAQTTGDLEARFLPYDVYNLAFSAAYAPYNATQISTLNQNILFAQNTLNGELGASSGTFGLVAGWYTSGGQGFDYVPSAWSANSEAYTLFVARSCRTCHTAVAPDWDSAGPSGVSGLATQAQGLICGNSAEPMPNSLITFNRFWDSTSSTNGLGTNQLNQFLSLFPSGAPTCNAPASPSDALHAHQRLRSN